MKKLLINILSIKIFDRLMNFIKILEVKKVMFMKIPCIFFIARHQVAMQFIKSNKMKIKVKIILSLIKNPISSFACHANNPFVYNVIPLCIQQ